MESIIKRAKEPTPKFNKKLRNIGLAIAAIGASIIAAPVALPAVVIQVAGYLTVAGGVLSGVSQVTVKNEKQ
jgi:hypothetical protein